MPTPVLHSQRLTLHPYTTNLVTEEHVAWLNDKELMQFSEQRHHRHTMKSQLTYVSQDLTNIMLWLFRCNGVDIGTMSAYIDPENHRVNIGILLGKQEYHGRGLATEAWKTVMEYFFDNGIHKVEAGCRSDNWAMRRLAVSAGMMLEAEIPGHFKVGGKYKGLVCYGRFKEDEYHSSWERMWNLPFWQPGRGSDETV